MATKLLHELSIAEAGAKFRSGALTSAALTEHALSRIASLDPGLHAFVLLTAERARADAAAADADFAKGVDHGPMHGVPYALKDIISTAGIRTTGHSKLLIDNVPTEDAEVAARLRKGGGVLLGKVGTFEFAIGGPSFDLPFPPARNPWNDQHTTGGSSSGSASAVAAGMVRTAMGSDTGGSIRGPAFYCGTVGIKPTYGRVSRRGVFPLSYTLDHLGPLSWTVEDAALTLQAIAGFDPADPGSADVPVPDFMAGFGQDLKGLKLAYPRKFHADDPLATAEIIASLDDAAQKLAALGAEVAEVVFPDYALFDACGRVILNAEAYAIHEKDLKSRPLDYGRYTFQRIAPGVVLSAADLVQAFRLRRELSGFVNREILGKYDAIVTATALSPAQRFDSFGKDATRWAGSRTIAFNVTGNPALAIPTGFSPDGLPLGMQVVGRAFDEPKVFRIGAAYEAATKWNETRPSLPMRMAS
jgi:aspartyl-tRNA(Asn)/glutamyl-tRNA(Gln) amidotransferase subunit A